MDNTEIHIVPNILMLVGLAAMGTNWFAGRICQDSLDPARFPRWKNFLLVWFAVAALLCSLLVSAVVLSYALQGHLEESLKVRVCACVSVYGCDDSRKVGRVPGDSVSWSRGGESSGYQMMDHNPQVGRAHVLFIDMFWDPK